MLIVLFLVSHFNFLFVPCGGVSWLPVSFLLHVKYTLSYRIVWHVQPRIWRTVEILVRVTHPANLCTICTSPKSTDQGCLLLLMLWVYLYSHLQSEYRKSCIW